MSCRSVVGVCPEYAVYASHYRCAYLGLIVDGLVDSKLHVTEVGCSVS